MEKLSYGGIDVSKDRLDVVVLPEGWFFSVSNDTAGWVELVARLHPLAVSAIGLEPSGGYERGIIRALLAAGLSVRRINPNKLRQFARARGVLAKNDRLDARLIAEYVAIMQAVLKAQINKTDRNDARGIAQMMRAGLYRPVHGMNLRTSCKSCLGLNGLVT